MYQFSHTPIKSNVWWHWFYISLIAPIIVAICWFTTHEKGNIVDFLNFWDGNWDNNILSNLEVDRSKTKQCCEASSKNGRSQLQTDEILRDFLHFQSWQHQKRNNPARLPQCSKLRTSKRKRFCEAFFKNGKLSAELTAAYQCVLWFFPLHLSKVLRLPRKSEARSYEVLHLSRKIILANLQADAPKCSRTEGSLEVKLPTIWTDKQRWAEAEKRKSQKRKSQKKEDQCAPKGI